MQEFIQDYLKQLVRLTDDKPAVTKHSTVPVMANDAIPISNPYQLILPAITWDWEVTADGSIPNKQFQFCDRRWSP